MNEYMREWSMHDGQTITFGYDCIRRSRASEAHNVHMTMPLEMATTAAQVPAYMKSPVLSVYASSAFRIQLLRGTLWRRTAAAGGQLGPRRGPAIVPCAFSR